MNELIALVESYGFDLIRQSDAGWTVRFGDGRELRIQSVPGMNNFALTGTPDEVSFLRDRFVLADHGGKIIVASGVLRQRVEELCRFLSAERLRFNNVTEASVDDLRNARLALLNRRADILAAEGTEVERLARQRRGQDLLAECLYLEYGRCFVTGLRQRALLVASHIKPWAACRGESIRDRLCIDNVLLLSVAYDKLFDRGFITFDDNGMLMASSRISRDELLLLGVDITEDIRICPSALTEGRLQFLLYHRENIFQG